MAIIVNYSLFSILYYMIRYETIGPLLLDEYVEWRRKKDALTGGVARK